jgi:hypothetical protein
MFARQQMARMSLEESTSRPGVRRPGGGGAEMAGRLDQGLARDVGGALELCEGLAAHLLRQSLGIAVLDRDLTPCHHAMASGAAFGTDELASEDTGASAPMARAHRQDENALVLARADDPLGAFKAEEEVGHLGGKIGPVHAADMADDDIIVDAGRLKRGGELAEIVRGDLGTLDVAELADVDERLEGKVSVDVLLRGATSKTHGVGLDAVKERGSKLGAGCDTGGLQILGEHGRDGADLGANVGKAGGGRLLAPGMMIEDDGSPIVLR